MQANDFRIGNGVLYKNEMCRLYGVIKKPNQPIDFYVETPTGNLFYANHNEIKVIDVTENILEKFGFEEKIGRYPHRLLFNDDDKDESFFIEAYRSKFNEKNWVFSLDREYVGINSVHKFQNLIYEVFGKELSVPFLK